MILSASQPFFFPYAGFFYKATLSDVFVLLDNVQFPRGTTWLSRNRFKNDQGSFFMTIPVWKKGLGLQKISDVKICHEGKWAIKHNASLKTAYKNAPYLQDHLEFIDQVFSSDTESLCEMNLKIIRYFFEQFSIDAKIVLLSQLNIKTTGNRLLLDICDDMKADCFLAQGPARKYLDMEMFKNRCQEIRFFRLPSIIYPQLWGDFIPNLSAFDLLLNCGPKSLEILKARSRDHLLYH
jgi:hypothetical protein